MRSQIESLIAEWQNRASEQQTVQAITLRACADRLTAILAADAGGWRPIAEAPTDGTPIIGWNGRVMLVAWGGQRPPKWREGSAFGPAAWIKPTHWRPLPEPPPQEPPR